MKKEYSVTQARENLHALIHEASIGIEIEIQVFGKPYVKLSRDVPEGRTKPRPLLAYVDEARGEWSQLLSAVANNDARFFFVAVSEADVFLTRIDGYHNHFLEKWEAHKRHYHFD